MLSAGDGKVWGGTWGDVIGTCATQSQTQGCDLSVVWTRSWSRCLYFLKEQPFKPLDISWGDIATPSTFFLSFHVEIITVSDTVAKMGQRGPVNAFTQFPRGCIFHIKTQKLTVVSACRVVTTIKTQVSSTTTEPSFALPLYGHGYSTFGLFYVSITWLFWECDINEIRRCVTFCDWIFPQHNVLIIHLSCVYQKCVPLGPSHPLPTS